MTYQTSPAIYTPRSLQQLQILVSNSESIFSRSFFRCCCFKDLIVSLAMGVKMSKNLETSPLPIETANNHDIWYKNCKFNFPGLNRVKNNPKLYITCHHYISNKTSSGYDIWCTEVVSNCIQGFNFSKVFLSKLTFEKTMVVSHTTGIKR